MIGDPPSETSDPELRARRAIDQAVSTLRTLAEETPLRAAPQPNRDTVAAPPFGDSLPPDRTTPTHVPLAPRLREGFHRLGIVLATPVAAAGIGVMLISARNPGSDGVGVNTGLALLALAGLAYLLCRAMAWVALGFTVGPAPGAAGSDPARPGGAERRRIGGWLWLPIIAIMSIVVLAIERAPRLLAFVNATLDNPTASGLFLVGAVALSYVLTAAWIYELDLMWRRRARARPLYVALSLSSLAAAAIFWVVWIFYFGMQPDGLLQSAAEELSHAVWIPYMQLSGRVRRTFVY